MSVIVFRDAPLLGTVSVETIPSSMTFKFTPSSPECRTKDETIQPNFNESHWKWRPLVALDGTGTNWDNEHTSDGQGAWRGKVAALGNLGDQKVNIQGGVSSININSNGMTQDEMVNLIREKESEHKAFSGRIWALIDGAAAAVTIALTSLALAFVWLPWVALALGVTGFFVSAANAILQYWASGWSDFEKAIRKIYPK